MLSACPLLKVVYFQRKHCRAYRKPASMPFQPALYLEKSLKDSWPVKRNFIFSPQIISFVPLCPCRLSTELEKFVCAYVHVWACVVYRLLSPVMQHGFSQYSFSLPAWKSSSSQWSSQLGSQTGSLQAAPGGKVCCLWAHKHCHSVKLPSSSKGYRVIRYTGEINSSAPEKSRTQLPHLLVHITHSLPLWWRIM